MRRRRQLATGCPRGLPKVAAVIAVFGEVLCDLCPHLGVLARHHPAAGETVKEEWFYATVAAWRDCPFRHVAGETASDSADRGETA